MFLNSYIFVRILEKEVYEKLKRELYINGGDSEVVDKLFNKKSFEEQTL